MPERHVVACCCRRADRRDCYRDRHPEDILPHDEDLCDCSCHADVYPEWYPEENDE